MYLILEDVQCLLQFINDLIIALSIQIFISDWKMIPTLFSVIFQEGCCHFQLVAITDFYCSSSSKFIFIDIAYYTAVCYAYHFKFCCLCI